jgi:hypothetical protein
MAGAFEIRARPSDLLTACNASIEASATKQKRKKERERERERGAKASSLLKKRDQTLGLADLLTNTINKAATAGRRQDDTNGPAFGVRL